MRSVNLLPWRGRRHRIRRRNALAALLCALAAAAGVVAGADLYLRQRLGAIGRETAGMRSDIGVHRAAAAEREELANSEARLSALLEELERIRRRNRIVQDWLALLPESLPRGFRLTRLTINGNSWQVQGIAPGMDEAAQFLGLVRDMPMVSDARIENLRSGSIQSRQVLLAGTFRE